MMLALAGQPAPAAERGDGATPTGNAVEHYAREWEQKFVVRDYVPADPLAKALHGYFKKLFAAAGDAARENPRDISHIVGEARTKLTVETAAMIETFVTAGYSRLDAMAYFDRLFPRLQLELAKSFLREQTSRKSLIKAEPAEVAKELMVKADTLFYERKEPAEALKALDDAVRFAPANVRLVLEEALQQEKFGLLNESRENFDLARQTCPVLVDIFYRAGIMRLASRDYYGAIEDLGMAIRLLPAAVRAYTYRGDARMQLKDFEGAIDDYGMQIAAGTRPGLGAAYNRRAEAHYRLEHYDLALVDVQMAIQLEPNFARDYRLLGMIQHRMKNHSAALTAYNKAIELKPDYRSAYAMRIFVRYNLGSESAAIADADKLVSLAPDLARAHILRAILFDLLDRTEAAEQGYREAIRVAKETSDAHTWGYAHFHLDLLMRRQGQVDDAYLADVMAWPDDWIKRIALHFAGRLSAQALSNASLEEPNRQDRFAQMCEANYYAGMLSWVGGNQVEGAALLKAATDPDFAENYEYAMAQKMLRQVDAGTAR